MRDRRDTPKLTPVPTSELSSLKRSLTRTETLIETLVETVIPPIAKDSREARDGVIQLTTSFIGMEKRVNTIETTPPICEKEATIASLETKSKAFEGWRKWVITVGVTVALALAGVAAKAISDSSETRTIVRQNSKQLETLTIKTIPANHRLVIKAVNKIPEEAAKEVLPMAVETVSHANGEYIKEVVGEFSPRTKRILLRTARPEELKALGLSDDN